MGVRGKVVIVLATVIRCGRRIGKLLNRRSLATPFSLTEDPAGSKFFTGLGLGSIGTTSDVDYWAFSGHAGQPVSVSADGGTGNNSIYIELRNASDTIIAQAGDTTAGHPQISNFMLPNEGTYYVKLRTYNSGYSLSSYDVRVDEPTGFTGESEPNDTIANASPITLTPGAPGQAIGIASGNVTTATDLDTFNLGNVRAGDQIDVAVPSSLKVGVSTLDPKVQILNAAGAVVATASGYGLSDGTNHAKFTATTDNVYYARVSANTASTAGDQALYLLQASIQASSTPVVIGNTLPTSTLNNNALSFDGASQHVSVPDSASLHASSVTLETWFNASKLDGSLHQLIGKQLGTGDNDSYGIWYQNGTLYAGVGDASSNATFSYGFTPVVGTWYHVALTYDAPSGVETLYLNGVAVATASTAKVVAYDTNPLVIGGDTTSGNFSYPWAGRLDEVRVWNFARPAVDIQADLGRVLTGSESGLVAYYRLEAGSGQTAADLTSNHNDGTLGGLGIPSRVTTGLPSVTGDAGALSFDGKNDYVAVPDSATVRPASALTVTAWVNFSALDSTRVIVAKPAGTGTNDSYVVWYASGALRAQAGSAAGQTSALGYGWTPTLGTWYHVAYTYDSSTGAQKLYVNGALVTSNTSAVALGYDAHPLLIGTDSNNESLNGSYFAGKIDEVTLWNVAQPVATIQTNMGKQLVGNEAGLASYYKFDEASGLTALDSTVNQNNGSLGNVVVTSPTWTTAGAPLNDLTTVPTAVQAIDRFTVNFNEDLLASAASNPNNYSLVEAGADGLFGTSDDVVYALTPSYSGDGSHSVGFTLAPNPLQPGHYQFRTRRSAPSSPAPTTTITASTPRLATSLPPGSSRTTRISLIIFTCRTARARPRPVRAATTRPRSRTTRSRRQGSTTSSSRETAARL
jgi:hypothetical protein